MKAEERYGFDAALEIDNEVWKIIPKIQARMLKSISGTDSGINALLEAFETKLTLEDFTFEIEKTDDNNGFKIYISQCPWYDLMVKSGREHLAEKVGSVICNTEYSVWASEFGDTIRFEMEGKLCGGNERCILNFEL